MIREGILISTKPINKDDYTTIKTIAGEDIVFICKEETEEDKIIIHMVLSNISIPLYKLGFVEGYFVKTTIIKY